MDRPARSRECARSERCRAISHPRRRRAFTAGSGGLRQRPGHL